MKGIVIDTTGGTLLAVAINGEKFYTYEGREGSLRHTGEVLLAADKALGEVGLVPKDLDVVGCVVGPGSFTGIRIGVATALAMATATDAKTVELTSLEIPAYQKGDVLSLLDCKHGYYAMKRVGGEVTYDAMEYADADASTMEKCFADKPNPDNLRKLFAEKVASGSFSEGFKPFYLKASSAEK